MGLANAWEPSQTFIGIQDYPVMKASLFVPEPILEVSYFIENTPPHLGQKLHSKFNAYCSEGKSTFETAGWHDQNY